MSLSLLENKSLFFSSDGKISYNNQKLIYLIITLNEEKQGGSGVQGTEFKLVCFLEGKFYTNE